MPTALKVIFYTARPLNCLKYNCQQNYDQYNYLSWWSIYFVSMFHLCALLITWAIVVLINKNLTLKQLLTGDFIKWVKGTVMYVSPFWAGQLVRKFDISKKYTKQKKKYKNNRNRPPFISQNWDVLINQNCLQSLGKPETAIWKHSNDKNFNTAGHGRFETSCSCRYSIHAVAVWQGALICKKMRSFLKTLGPMTTLHIVPAVNTVYFPQNEVQVCYLAKTQWRCELTPTHSGLTWMSHREVNSEIT